MCEGEIPGKNWVFSVTLVRVNDILILMQPTFCTIWIKVDTVIVLKLM